MGFLDRILSEMVQVLHTDEDTAFKPLLRLCVVRFAADLSKIVAYSIAWHDHLLDGL